MVQILLEAISEQMNVIGNSQNAFPKGGLCLTNFIAPSMMRALVLWTWGKQWMLYSLTLPNPLTEPPSFPFPQNGKILADKWVMLWVENWLDRLAQSGEVG